MYFQTMLCVESGTCFESRISLAFYKYVMRCTGLTSYLCLCYYKAVLFFWQVGTIRPTECVWCLQCPRFIPLGDRRCVTWLFLRYYWVKWKS